MLISAIVALEWDMFDKTQNRGGRASCQDDYDTFAIMRRSQLAVWNPPLLESYHADLTAAQSSGRNLISEKYGHMMARTDPAAHAQIAHLLPPRNPATDAQIAQICAAHVAWIEALVPQFPHLVGRGRGIRKDTDTPLSTSFETYLWGELASYSHGTVALYATFVAHAQQAGRNLNQEILQHTVAHYGYADLPSAEAFYANRQR